MPARDPSLMGTWLLGICGISIEHKKLKKFCFTQVKAETLVIKPGFCFFSRSLWGNRVVQIIKWFSVFTLGIILLRIIASSFGNIAAVAIDRKSATIGSKENPNLLDVVWPGKTCLQYLRQMPLDLVKTAIKHQVKRQLDQDVAKNVSGVHTHWTYLSNHAQQTSYVLRKWLTEPKIVSLSEPGPHIE